MGGCTDGLTQQQGRQRQVEQEGIRLCIWEPPTRRAAHQLRFASTHKLLRLMSAEIPCGIEPRRRVLYAVLKGQR